MRTLSVAASALALGLAGATFGTGSANAGIAEPINLGCKVPQSVFKSNGKGGQVAFFSSNTNAGDGNGAEVAVNVGDSFFLCADRIPAPDQGVQIGNAQDPVLGIIATDPGNSP